MDCVYYSDTRKYEIKKVQIPDIKDHQVLLKVLCCGVCGTDNHVHEGDFLTTWPLIPGHEIVGVVEKVGKSVDAFTLGERCVVDPVVLCGNCHYCRRGNGLMCINFNGLGVTMNGGFAEYIAVDANKLYRISNLSNEAATLIEPASCAVHGVDKLALAPGSDVLIIGAGPTGIVLSQLLKLNGASQVVMAANSGPKTKLAKELNAADTIIELDRTNPKPQWEQLKSSHPYGFDAVIEATGHPDIANDAINYVRRGGKLMLYGVYDSNALVHYPPSKIFGDEITIIGSFAQVHCFPRAIQYLDGGKVKVEGLVTHSFKIADYGKALAALRGKEAVKIVITP